MSKYTFKKSIYCLFHYKIIAHNLMTDYSPKKSYLFCIQVHPCSLKIIHGSNIKPHL